MKVSRKVLGLLLSGLLTLVSLIGWWGLGVSRADGPLTTDQAPVVAREWPDWDGAFDKEVAFAKEIADTISPRLQVQQSEAKQKSQKTQVARESLHYDGKSFREWRTYLTTELKPKLRFEGLKAMGIFGVNGYAEEAASVILEVVKGHNLYSGNVDDQKVTSAAGAAIRRISPATLPVLIRALKDRKAKYARRFSAHSPHHSDYHSLHRSTAVTPLWPEMKAAVPALIEAVSNDDAPLRRLAITALSTIDPDDERVVAALIDATKDKDRDVCDQAVNVLGRVWRHRNRTIPALIEAMKNKDANIRETAIRALGNITRDPKVLVPPLIEALKSEYQDDWQNTRDSACRLLGKLGPKARETVSALLAVFWVSKPHVRIQIFSALGKIGTEDTAAFKFLAKVASDQTEPLKVQHAAAEVMKQILRGKQFKARNESEDPDPFDDEDQ